MEMHKRAVLFFAGALVLFALGDFVIYGAAVWGSPCAECSLLDPDIRREFDLPFLCGVALLVGSGWLFHRGRLSSPESELHLLSDARQRLRLSLAMLTACGCGIGLLVLLFVVVATVSG
jgi:hypothetical protein